MDRDQNHKAFLLQAVNFAAALITEPTFLRTFIYLYPVHLEIVEHPPILYKC